MNDREENKVSMFEAVNDFGQDPAWAAVIASVDDLQNGFAQLGHLLPPITGSTTSQNTSTQQGKGATADKKARKAALVDGILAVSGPLSALGAQLDDNEMIAVADTSAAKLSKLRDGILGSRATSIHTLATAHAAALIPKGVTAAKLTALATLTANWEARLQRPRQHKAEAAGHKVAVTNAIKLLDTFLKKQLDKLMLPFRSTHPSFYAAYKAARVIHDTAGAGEEDPPPPPTP